jgi:hypothetical protein
VSNQSLFIGDSHTCGFKSVLEKFGNNSYSYWNENNYADIYSNNNNKPVAVYARAGVNNRVYIDWIKTLVNYYPTADEAFICLAPLNRFYLGFDPEFSDKVIPVDNFTNKDASSNGIIDRFCDDNIKNEHIQIFNKPTDQDYYKFPGINFDHESGLTYPDLRKHSYMEIKLFFELNSFIEKRDYCLNLFAWDRICTDNGVRLYVFNMMERAKYPTYNNYYGELKSTVISPVSVEGFFKKKFINPEKYLLDDQEHYNYDYHQMISNMFIPWLKTI